MSTILARLDLRQLLLPLSTLHYRFENTLFLFLYPISKCFDLSLTRLEMLIRRTFSVDFFPLSYICLFVFPVMPHLFPYHFLLVLFSPSTFYLFLCARSLSSLTSTSSLSFASRDFHAGLEWTGTMYYAFDTRVDPLYRRLLVGRPGRMKTGPRTSQFTHTAYFYTYLSRASSTFFFLYNYCCVHDVLLVTMDLGFFFFISLLGPIL